ncbi:MAG: N-glycosylase/DNA lyase [Candidatus Aenigmarchaeota archaeon]|nr:N-glycosylase/DNA lyase [Candidatus Aenigmarchaeota archaeon]
MNQNACALRKTAPAESGGRKTTSQLVEKINSLKQSPISLEVNKRLREFQELGKKESSEWFSELCFCILTANSKAATALEIQKELGSSGFLNKSQNNLSASIKRNKHRFHNTKARYITEARKFSKIKTILSREKNPREWLVKNVKGLGWKESSHFLRNTGSIEYAILDRHIINLLHAHKIINQTPKSLPNKTYLEIEKVFKDIAYELKMSPAELDLYMWYSKTGKVLK